MKFKREFLRLYFIAGLENASNLPELLELALKSGITIFQYREKNLPLDELKIIALDLQKLCKKYSVPFVLNDYWELALEIKADGVHIGQGDEAVKKVIAETKNKLFLGLSVNNLEQAKLNNPILEIDYFGVGALFPTNSKLDAKVAGLDLLSSIRKANITKPIVGIGGITADNALSVIKAGADGIAVISAITKAENVELAVKNLLKLRK